MLVEAFSVENAEEYFKAMDDETQCLMIIDTWKIFLRNSVSDHKVITRTWYFKCKRKHYWTIRKFKARYFVRWYVNNILSPEPLNSYSPVLQWATVILMFILQCNIGLQSQSIDFTDSFAQADISSGGGSLN